MPFDQDSRSLSPRRLTKEDAASGLQLSTAAGWNQVANDWEVLITMGQGIGMVDPSDKLAATAILLPHRPRVRWVSMFLVDEAWRKRGIGTRLMKLIIELSPDPVLGLDATEQGRPVYENLGFVATESITRFARQATGDISPAIPDEQVKNLSEKQFRDLLIPFTRDCDKSRRKLLRMLDASGDGRICLLRGDRTAGLATMRAGRLANQIGPIFATDAASATTIVRSVASDNTGALIIDVPDRHEAFAKQVASIGFEPSTSFTRMFRAGQPLPNPSEYAIAGPEFG